MGKPFLVSLSLTAPGEQSTVWVASEILGRCSEALADFVSALWILKNSVCIRGRLNLQIDGRLFDLVEKAIVQPLEVACLR
jgi:hypothetical protein